MYSYFMSLKYINYKRKTAFRTKWLFCRNVFPSRNISRNKHRQEKKRENTLYSYFVTFADLSKSTDSNIDWKPTHSLYNILMLKQ